VSPDGDDGTPSECEELVDRLRLKCARCLLAECKMAKMSDGDLTRREIQIVSASFAMQTRIIAESRRR